jgi:hypothetical protein
MGINAGGGGFPASALMSTIEGLEQEHAVLQDRAVALAGRVAQGEEAEFALREACTRIVALQQENEALLDLVGK